MNSITMCTTTGSITAGGYLIPSQTLDRKYYSRGLSHTIADPRQEVLQQGGYLIPSQTLDRKYYEGGYLTV